MDLSVEPQFAQLVEKKLVGVWKFKADLGIAVQVTTYVNHPTLCSLGSQQVFSHATNITGRCETGTGRRSNSAYSSGKGSPVGHGSGSPKWSDALNAGGEILSDEAAGRTVEVGILVARLFHRCGASGWGHKVSSAR
jgi:hypothetical protein